MRFGIDGDGNYGYYGADGSLVPFKGKLELEQLPESAIVLNGYKQLIINPSGYSNLLVFDYCSQWYVNSSDPVGAIHFSPAIVTSANKTTFATLIYFENIVSEQVILYRTGSGTGNIGTPFIYGF